MNASMSSSPNGETGESDDPIPERAAAVLRSRPTAGRLTWLVRHENMNHPAGHRNKVTGYVMISFENQLYAAHRLAWYFIHGEVPQLPLHIDHINRDKMDNRIGNLRIATSAQNQANANMLVTNTSGIKGVARRGDRWRAFIRINGRPKHLGTFDTKELAAEAYRSAAKAIRGEFAT